MTLHFSQHGWQTYMHWKNHQPAIAKRVERLVAEIHKTPYSGLGKPAPLQKGLNGYWSRRINSQHRLLYKIQGQTLLLAPIQYRYR